ncbi:MAG: hypothetical protein QNJ47_11565 [Nostocaceae cyanobacterium]|nr:hypothetical protein [Nostocaceae cyanobacterium]
MDAIKATFRLVLYLTFVEVRSSLGKSNSNFLFGAFNHTTPPLGEFTDGNQFDTTAVNHTFGRRRN